MAKSKSVRLARGRLIVFEGIDGSGKTTQVNLLLKYLKSKKISFSKYSFPRYDKPWGKLVRRYLSGEFGGAYEVNPYLASVLYAGDRLDASTSINNDLSAGKIVVCDRYVASNIAHQAVKLQTPNSKLQFIKWVQGFEYNQNKIPKEDLVILLSVPVGFSQNLMKSRKKDIHEKDRKYMQKVARVFEDLTRSKKNWHKIECVENGKLLSKEDIHGKVIKIINR